MFQGTASAALSGDDEDTAEDYYTEEKASTGKKRRGRKPKVVEEEDADEANEEGERPKRKRAYKKSKKALDAEGIMGAYHHNIKGIGTGFRGSNSGARFTKHLKPKIFLSAIQFVWHLRKS